MTWLEFLRAQIGAIGPGPSAPISSRPAISRTARLGSATRPRIRTHRGGHHHRTWRRDQMSPRAIGDRRSCFARQSSSRHPRGSGELFHVRGGFMYSFNANDRIISSGCRTAARVRYLPLVECLVVSFGTSLAGMTNRVEGHPEISPADNNRATAL